MSWAEAIRQATEAMNALLDAMLADQRAAEVRRIITSQRVRRHK